GNDTCVPVSETMFGYKLMKLTRNPTRPVPGGPRMRNESYVVPDLDFVTLSYETYHDDKLIERRVATYFVKGEPPNELFEVPESTQLVSRPSELVRESEAFRGRKASEDHLSALDFNYDMKHLPPIK